MTATADRDSRTVDEEVLAFEMSCGHSKPRWAANKTAPDEPRRHPVERGAGPSGSRLMPELSGQDNLKNNRILSALVGLTVAWGGTVLLLSPANRLLGAPDRLRTKILEQLACGCDSDHGQFVGRRNCSGGGRLSIAFPELGRGPMLTYFVAVGLAMGFFAWRRDLVANIIAHTVVDGMALVIIPVLSRG